MSSTCPKNLNMIFLSINMSTRMTTYQKFRFCFKGQTKHILCFLTEIIWNFHFSVFKNFEETTVLGLFILFIDLFYRPIDKKLWQNVHEERNEHSVASITEIHIRRLLLSWISNVFSIYVYIKHIFNIIRPHCA